VSIDTERAVIATVLLHPDQYRAVAQQIVATDFMLRDHRVLWTALAELHTRGQPDLPLILDALTDHDADLRAVVLDTLQAPAPSPSLLDRHIARLLEQAARRRLIDIVAQASAELADGAPTGRVTDDLRVGLDRVTVPTGQPPADWLTASAVLAVADDTPEPWLIPGLLRRRSRVVYVAEEGAGKSVFGRQLAVAAAVGAHPFKPAMTIPNRRALIVDYENDHHAVHRADQTLDPTSIAALIRTGQRLDPGWNADDWLSVWTRPRGTNLRDRLVRQEFRAILDTFAPDIVVIGPAYRMADRLSRESDEEMAKAVTGILDELRDDYGFSVFVEAHAGHGYGGTRNLRPLGSSVYLRWPEHGLSLAKTNGSVQTLTVTRWREPRYEAGWPDQLIRSRLGERWPFTARTTTPRSTP
jgi:hypothetical protein